MSIHNYLNTIESAVVKNKWFVLASLALMCTVGTTLYVYTDYMARPGACLSVAERHLYGGSNSESEEMHYANAAAAYRRCLTVQGVDYRSVPSLYEMYAYPEGDIALEEEDFDDEPEFELDYMLDEEDAPLE